ncbi:MAG TPA: hypothetical protein VNO31_25160 [Umezawaea sp.]|nr:hypothetical protein [Umezawaea sp.]
MPPHGRTADLLSHPLIARLVALGLDPGDFVLFGSAPLLAHGLRAEIRDLDVVARGDAWRYAWQHGVRGVGKISGDEVAQFWGGRVQFSRRWIPPARSADELIDTADVVDGLRFARLTDVLAYKQLLRRPKDVADIGVIGLA